MIIDDKTIIQAIRGRTEVGFKLLMQKYKQPIYWHIRRLVVSLDDAQDATQEAFIRIFRSFNQLKDEKSFQGWLFRIATNLLNVYQEDIFINELRIKALAVK